MSGCKKVDVLGVRGCKSRRRRRRHARRDMRAPRCSHGREKSSDCTVPLTNVRAIPWYRRSMDLVRASGSCISSNGTTRHTERICSSMAGRLWSVYARGSEMQSWRLTAFLVGFCAQNRSVRRSGTAVDLRKQLYRHRLLHSNRHPWAQSTSFVCPRSPSRLP